MPRIYLDNAATSFPKPPEVYDAMLRYARDVGASPGRGQYAESREGAAVLSRCRELLCRFLDAESPDRIVFALNTSDALNLAIKGVVRAARLRHGVNAPIRLVTTAMDHNSVLRPFAALAEEGATVVHVRADARTGLVNVEDVRAALTPETTLVAVNAVSNVTGSIQDYARIAELCADHNVPCLIDAAQALGHVSFSVRDVPAHMVAFPGHKGLLGPQGTGGLYIRPGFEDRLATTREGGTGSLSELDAQPLEMPQRYEAGSHNTMGIAGWCEGVAWLLERGMHNVRAHEMDLMHEVLGGLARARIDGLRLLGPTDARQRVATFSFVHETLMPSEIAAILESEFGLLTRAGLLCAPLAHDTLGTLSRRPDGSGDPSTSGALRMSFGPFNTREHARCAVEGLAAVCSAAVE